MNIINKKGFTLVEILAVVIVLACIFMVLFPNFLHTAKKNEEKKYDNMVKNLCLSGESYIYLKKEYYEEYLNIGNTIEINIEELMAYGSVDKNLKDIKTGKSISDSKLMYTVLEDYSLTCEYISE